MKICVLVIDAFGIGASADAESYGDAGSNTYGHVLERTGVRLPNMEKLGLNAIDGVAGEQSVPSEGAYARLTEISPGKDTTTGHWELAGIVADKPFPTYPNGFPKEIVEKLETRTGRKMLFNGVASGTEIIRRLGEESMQKGMPILYTSADSVCQIAAHVDSVPLAELYHICEVARELLVGEFAVGRVIARPFATVNGEFARTADRKDFSLPPTGVTVMDRLKEDGYTVYAVGKIADIFADRGITIADRVHGNAACLQATEYALSQNFTGLVFTNLVDTDMLYGHRRDAEGYADSLREIDAFLPRLQTQMGARDVLMITADHGCDPTFRGTDHTREDVPLLIWGAVVKPENLGTKHGFHFVADFILQKFQLTE